MLLSSELSGHQRTQPGADTGCRLVNGRDEFKPAWIFSAAEPMVASLNDRGYDVEFDAVDIGSTDLQREIDAVVDFLWAAIARLDEVSSAGYAQLVDEAQAIVPPVDRGSPPRW
jgi:hypothetical protein